MIISRIPGRLFPSRFLQVSNNTPRQNNVPAPRSALFILCLGVGLSMFSAHRLHTTCSIRPVKDK